MLTNLTVWRNGTALKSGMYALKHTRVHMPRQENTKHTDNLLYKDKMLSVRLSAVFFGTHVAPWFMHGSTPDLLDMKRPSLGNTEIF